MSSRKIDALIAEHVFDKKGPWDLDWEYVTYDDDKPREHLPLYSNDIALAISVLEKLAEGPAGFEWSWAIKRHGQSGKALVHLWRVNESHSKEYKSPLPEAICRHVLHVFGVTP